MRVDEKKCLGCGICVKFCPMDSIWMQNSHAYIDEDECVDCGACLKSARCPSDAIFMPPECFEYPRVLRMQFSDVCVKHPKQTTAGRGTEEAKTNDVTGKFKRGEFGLILEFGRPCVGVRFAEVEKITIAVEKMELEILEDNPFYNLLEEGGKGRFKKECLNEKILSTILELRIPSEERLFAVLEEIIPQINALDTLVSVGVITRFDEDGSLGIKDRLEERGIPVRPNAKINVGLGRPLIS